MEAILQCGHEGAGATSGLTLDPTHDQYSVTSDGQRFLVRLPVAESAPITVVVNWDAAMH